MRIFVICYEYPPVGGGGGRVAASVAKGLVRRGHTARVLTSRVGELASEEIIDGVLVRRAFAARRRQDRCTIPEMAAYIVLHALPAIAEIRRFRPDVVHVHFAVPSGLVARWATLFAKVPYVLTAHLGDVPGGVPEQTDGWFKLVKPFTLGVWRKAARTTAVSSFVAGLARRAYGVSPEIVLNGVDMTLAAKDITVDAAAPLRLIWCGRIQQQKNLVPALDALRAIADQNWTLDIVGDGPLRADAEEMCRSSDMAQRVRFHGWRAGAEVKSLMAACDVLFMPSLSEGLSLVTVEALRAGLAIVASNVPGFDDVVTEDENGILCDPKQPAEFARVISDLVSDRQKVKAMRAASLGRAPRFDTELMVDRYEEILLSASGRTS